ncbi:hypothetical protein [Virgisporangium ochraceum]|uniref:Lipoprotein n=1 Tax=Virgisporangium ochraceum TaxID=65505 RepID=A0A8J4EI55_9ACTN|nr:hypothetical protein [Virgisporangium ochraceum]GIJ75386.1 hypothetical protein Voc01_103030 [Virgisporangium ochraceum]
MKLRLTALAVGMLVSACGGEGPAGPESTPPAQVDAGALAIRVEYVGGFLPGIEVVSRPPLVSVYGDGRVIADGPVRASHPGPALPNVQEWRIPPAEVASLAGRVLAADGDFGRPTVTDMPDTRFTVTTTDGVRRVVVYALTVDDRATRSLTDAQRAARAKLLAVRNDLTDARDDPDAYPMASLAVFSLPYREPTPADRAAPPVAWTGPALPGDPVGPDGEVGCVTVTGDAAATVRAAAATANAATPWTADGRTWYLRFRPLLPGESGCADVTGR